MNGDILSSADQIEHIPLESPKVDIDVPDNIGQSEDSEFYYVVDYFDLGNNIDSIEMDKIKTVYEWAKQHGENVLEQIRDLDIKIGKPVGMDKIDKMYVYTKLDAEESKIDKEKQAVDTQKKSLEMQPIIQDKTDILRNIALLQLEENIHLKIRLAQVKMLLKSNT